MKSKRKSESLRVAVVGAGAFGGWTALHLLRKGNEVVLLDAWGPGNSRASSGGESRVIRAIYGPYSEYAKLMARALTLWEESERRWKAGIFIRTGGLWFFEGDDTYASASLPILAENGLYATQLSMAEATERFSQINFQNVRSVYFEPEAGYVLARTSCQTVVRDFISEGGTYIQASVTPGCISAGSLQDILCSDNKRVAANAYVFACGPWLGNLFPDVIGQRIQPTRQEVYYFGLPAGDRRFSDQEMPVWVDFHGPPDAASDSPESKIYYGIPGNQFRGFKIASNALGDPFDPTSGDRTPTASLVEEARRHLRYRFPDLGNPPLLEARVCQYENSPDSHFIIDRHPELDNVWIVGGGSGHGFKMGPAVGELAANLIIGKGDIVPLFSFKRFDGQTNPLLERNAMGAFQQE